MPLPGAGHPGQRSAPHLGQQVNLAGQPAPGPAHASRFLSFDGAPEAHRGAQLRQGQPRRVHIGGRQAPRPGRVLMGPHRPWHRPPPPSPGHALHRTRPAARSGSFPRSRQRTSGDAGYRPCSSSRTAPADPATGTRPGPGGTPHRSPAGDHSTDAPAADDGAATAPAAPTPHRSDHAASAGPHPRPNPTGNRRPKSISTP